MARKTAIKEPIAPLGLPLDQPLIGHEHAQSSFLDALQSGRMHHGWLLHGPKGVGKARFAAEAAAFLVAEAARRTDGLSIDLNHPDARLVSQGAHPDLHWIDRRTGSDGKKLPKTIPVAAVRASLQKLQSTAAYGGWRALVVDSVDELNADGANALLKPLEEPSERTILFLVAHALNQVLPTIRSRCRHLAFAPLDNASLREVAQRLSENQQIDLAMALANGRPGAMLALANNPDALDVYRAFCQLAAQAGVQSSRETVPSRLVLSAQFAGLVPEQRDLVLGLIEDWFSRRVRGDSEPGDLAAPAPATSPSLKNDLASLWSEHTAAIGVRQAINLDLSERMMTLFDRLDQVYRLG